MAYNCPRCGDSVKRGSSTAAQIGGGLVGALIYAAFGAFNCNNCGKLAKSEFPPEDRSKMMMGSIGLVVAAIVLLIVVIFIIVALR